MINYSKITLTNTIIITTRYYITLYKDSFNVTNSVKQMYKQYFIIYLCYTKQY